MIPKMVSLPVLGLIVSVTASLPGLAATPDEAAVLRVTEEWQKAWDKDDLERLEQLLAEDVSMESASLKATFKDKKSFLEAVKKMKAQQKGKMFSYVTTVTDAKVTITGDDASVTRTFYTERTGGGERPWKSSSRTKEMRLRKQSNGEWKIYHEK